MPKFKIIKKSKLRLAVALKYGYVLELGLLEKLKRIKNGTS
jgi:hypothetical protein